MKVICIDARINSAIMPSISVKEGFIYEVVNSEMERGTFLIYQLAEYPDEIINNRIVEFWFEASVFIPLSEIDETEMVREYKKVLLNNCVCVCGGIRHEKLQL